MSTSTDTEQYPHPDDFGEGVRVKILADEHRATHGEVVGFDPDDPYQSILVQLEGIPMDPDDANPRWFSVEQIEVAPPMTWDEAMAARRELEKRGGYAVICLIASDYLRAAGKVTPSQYIDILSDVEYMRDRSMWDKFDLDAEAEKILGHFFNR